MQNWSAGDSVMVGIPWPPTRLEGTTLEWRQRSAKALAFFLTMSPLPELCLSVRKPGMESICGSRDGVVAEICHLFKWLLSLWGRRTLERHLVGSLVQGLWFRLVVHYNSVVRHDIFSASRTYPLSWIFPLRLWQCPLEAGI